MEVPPSFLYRSIIFYAQTLDNYLCIEYNDDYIWLGEAKETVWRKGKGAGALSEKARGPL